MYNIRLGEKGATRLGHVPVILGIVATALLLPVALIWTAICSGWVSAMNVWNFSASTLVQRERQRAEASAKIREAEKQIREAGEDDSPEAREYREIVRRRPETHYDS